MEKEGRKGWKYWIAIQKYHHNFGIMGINQMLGVIAWEALFAGGKELSHGDSG